MPDYKSTKTFENALDRAIDKAMQGRVLDGVKEQIAKSVQEDVYDVYTPKFYSRRGESGGMKDKQYMHEFYDSATKTLIVDHITPWQHLKKGGAKPHEVLNDAVESGDNSHRWGAYMFGAPPRQYTDEAENTYAKSAFDIDLELSLQEQGF